MIEALIRWTTAIALPFWLQKGFDTLESRFRERLDLKGEAIAEHPLRSMVQARQIFVYAHAAKLGWAPEGAEVAERAMSALRRDFSVRFGDEESCAFAIDGAGRVSDERRDSYAHAFILFAAAHLYAINGDRELLRFAERIAAFMARRMTDGVSGGHWAALPLVDRCKRQNPHMHLLEAHLALARVAPEGPHLDRARALVTLFLKRIYDGDAMVLREDFEQDWSRCSQIERRDVIEPGHMFEWAWLLDEYRSLSNDSRSLPARDLFLTARRCGLREDDRIVDEMDGDLRHVRRSTRLWPHAEAIKAAARIDASATMAPSFADDMARTLLDTFIRPATPGGWIDHFDASGSPLVDYMPASSLYHIVFAASEAARASARHQRATRGERRYG